MSELDPTKFAADLLSSIKAAVGSGRNVDDGEDDIPDSGRVPYARLQREIARRHALEAKFEALGAKVTEMASAHRGAVESLKKETAEQLAQLQTRHVEDITLTESGLSDPLGREALRAAWSREPKASRGKSAAEWWSGITAAQLAHAENPKEHPAPKVPPTLVSYLPQGGSTADGAPGAGGQRAPTPPGARAPMEIESFDADQGMAAFLSALRPQS